uniref:Methyltransferase type 11 domain-containing protein n=1 Tax=Falco tinnunculus TaxID=100819 RepID=A0A8C4U358_FALTI
QRGEKLNLKQMQFNCSVNQTPNETPTKLKQELFCNLPDFTGPSGELRLLEIGTGCGANFQFYPPAAGEDLHQVPSGSMDAVVCTLVLCSVHNVNGTLKEVLRVLRPGGAFYFLEHVAADRSSWKYFWQQVCSLTWKLIFDGCCLTRELQKNLEEANFSELHLQQISLAYPWTPIQPHIIGYAIK